MTKLGRGIKEEKGGGRWCRGREGAVTKAGRMVSGKGGSCDESTGGRREEEREDGVGEGGNYDKRGKMEGKRESGSTKGGCGEGDRLQ
ncbi:hypothetical protein B296_00008385 [Ensete ventricosum]|uniref:Uncharacterized protein n=1 Tax=Ensete ventricosum TaxID=4639 RepID=A0A426YZN4_ENSVE|nr:hypothetical protein B296_00008385 [Ensete ventricosum]